MEWQQGPTLPVDMGGPCAVAITATSFLAIFGDVVREFDAAIAGPTSNEGWRVAGMWPSLKTSRSSWPGCVKFGQKVIIAGGWDGATFQSTEILDLDTRQIILGGDMAMPRHYFHLATIRSGGMEKVFALSGFGGSSWVNTVEEWVEESSTWKAADSLSRIRGQFGTVAVPIELICSA